MKQRRLEFFQTIKKNVSNKNLNLFIILCLMDFLLRSLILKDFRNLMVILN